MQSLPGDNITEEEAIELAKKHECPSSNICRYCGQPAVTMAFTMTGACSGDHSKLRWDSKTTLGSPVEGNNALRSSYCHEHKAIECSHIEGEGDPDANVPRICCHNLPVAGTSLCTENTESE